MKVESNDSQTLAVAQHAALFVGRLIRRQGQYGTVAVVGRVNGLNVELLDDPSKVFERGGVVEAQGLAQVTRVNPGDWVEFDVVKNNRPRGPVYKILHLHRLARFAPLPDLPLERHRTILTKAGWRGDTRPGPWALRVSEDKVLLTDLELGKDGALRIPRKATAHVHWFELGKGRVAQLPADGSSEDVFLADVVNPTGWLDWSDEADHVAQVIRSLHDAKDSRLAELITWLELHHEAGTGRLVAGAINHDAAEASLRSGELAERLRADSDLMNAYLDAAVLDDAVRDAVAEYAREGRDAEALRLREQLARDMSTERARRIAEIDEEVIQKRAKALEQIESELAKNSRELTEKAKERDRALDKQHAEKLKALNEEASQQREMVRQQISAEELRLTAAKAATDSALNDLERENSETEIARKRLQDVQSDIDRLLAAGEALHAPRHLAGSDGATISVRRVPFRFAELPVVGASTKWKTVATQPLLSEVGKTRLRTFLTLLLSSELPLLVGRDVDDFLKVAEATICPGRFAVIEADPTMISIEDVWCRPGSGVSTAVAAAADAASGGAVLVFIKEVERSGARFWLPSLRAALRNGSLPRGLFVCCGVNDREHEEIGVLPHDFYWLNITDAMSTNALVAGPSLLSSPALERTTLDPGPEPSSLSAASKVLLSLGFKPSLSLSMRVARVFAEAHALLGSESEAAQLATEFARSLNEQGEKAKKNTGGSDA